MFGGCRIYVSEDLFVTISGEGIRKNCAFSDKFLSFGIKVGMVQEISKTTANKVGLPPDGWFALNPIWLPLKTKKCHNSGIICPKLMYDTSF